MRNQRHRSTTQSQDNEQNGPSKVNALLI
jgi:hypothetical protein